MKSLYTSGIGGLLVPLEVDQAETSGAEMSRRYVRVSDRLHSNEKAAAFTKETGGGANSCGYLGGFRLGASTAVAHRAEGYLGFRGSFGFVQNEI